MSTAIALQALADACERVLAYIQISASCTDALAVETALDAARAALSKAQDEPADFVKAEQTSRAWVCTRERLPEADGMAVAVRAPGAMQADVWPATWRADTQNFDAALGWFEVSEVTHWMPLPAAPTLPEATP